MQTLLVALPHEHEVSLLNHTPMTTTLWYLFRLCNFLVILLLIKKTPLFTLTCSSTSTLQYQLQELLMSSTCTCMSTCMPCARVLVCMCICMYCVCAYVCIVHVHMYVLCMCICMYCVCAYVCIVHVHMYLSAHVCWCGCNMHMYVRCVLVWICS